MLELSRTAAAKPVDVEFVLVVEAGVLEQQARLLCESIRLFAGTYRDAPIIAISPLPGRRPSRHFIDFAEQTAVEYLELTLETECPEYPTTNRIYAAADRANRSRADILVVLDTDTLLVKEPDFRLEDADVAVRPVDVKGMCTTGDGDRFEPYWRSLCELGGLDYDELPFVTATIDGARVKASYNGGLVVVRRGAGILQQAADLFGRAARAGLCPRTRGEEHVFASTGPMGEVASAFWGTAQATMSVAMWRSTSRVRVLDPTYNVPLHAWDRWCERHPQVRHLDLVHVHYHWLCSPQGPGSNPLVDGRLLLSPEFAEWIRPRVPFRDLRTDVANDGSTIISPGLSGAAARVGGVSPSRSSARGAGASRNGMTSPSVERTGAPANGRPLAVLVLGMHRSGTSLAAEILGQLGCWLGAAQDLIGATAYNERGHFELVAGVLFDNAVLQAAGGTWDRPPCAESIETLAATMRPEVEAWFGGRTPLAFKDPRLCLTLPVWRAGLSSYDVRIVHLLRDPHAVARSMITRDRVMDAPASHFAKGAMTPADAINLWGEYNRRAAVYEQRFALPCLYVWYDALIDDAEAQVQRLAAFIDREDADLGAALGCVTPALRRHSA